MKKKALILGLGISGKAAAKLLINSGYEVLAIDDHLSSIDLPVKMVTGRGVDFDEICMLVPSPGIPRIHPIYVAAKSMNLPIVGEAQLALSLAKCKVIGITGTNGKSTTVSLVAHVLNKCGLNAHAVGNIGVAVSQVVETVDENAILVVELSSFQLETMHTGVLDHAAILGITPDHLDRYKDFDTYARMKLHIADCLKEGGKCYISKEVNNNYPDYCDKMIAVERDSIAYLLCSHYGITEKQFSEAKKSFTSLPHRLQEVAFVNGIRCINDSKATNIEATIHAVEKIGSKIILIAGGISKTDSFLKWVAPFQGKVKAIYTIGAAAGLIAKDLQGHFPTQICGTLEEAITAGLSIGKEGDVLLLSPGCSSFDQFKNFEHRGERFTQGINNESKRYHSCCSTH